MMQQQLEISKDWRVMAGPRAEQADEYLASAKYYDLIYAQTAPQDLSFYGELAKQFPGPVLELGCGTGRVALELARRGHRMVALDLSPAMLGMLQQKLAAEPAAVRQRVELVQGDMERLELGSDFALIIAPFRAFQHLLTAKGQRACLGAVQRHLKPDGRFVYNAFNPSLQYIVAAQERGAVWQQDHECVDAASGHTVRRYHLCRYDASEQVNDLSFKYEEYDAQGALLGTCIDRMGMRWQYRWEAQYLLELCGFEIEHAYGDYDKSPLDEQARELIFVCRKAGRE